LAGGEEIMEAIRIIKDEHRSLGAVLHGMLYLVHRTRTGATSRISTSSARWSTTSTPFPSASSSEGGRVSFGCCESDFRILPRFSISGIGETQAWRR
jgi:hypothetical protein